MTPKLRELIAGLAVIAGGLWLMLGVCGCDPNDNDRMQSRASQHTDNLRADKMAEMTRRVI